MEDFLSYCENKSFVRWVYHPDKQTNDYWEEYLKHHPKERKEIELSRLLLSLLKSKKEPDSQQDISEIFYKIGKKIEQKKKTLRLKRVFVSFSKYAALVLIFLSIGIALVKWREQSNFKNQIANVPAFDSKDARLIMAHKSIIIKKKESKIEYCKNGEVIINKKDTIRRTSSKSPTPELNELIVPYGKSSSITLSDGTIAYLNAGSRLLYSSYFEGNSRKVYLVGEAYFEVSHNPQKPFIVKTNRLNVKALGTSFNVSAYPGDQITEVVLVTGKVGIEENTFKLFGKQQIIFPSQLASFNRRTNKMTVKRVKIDNYTAWHKGYMNFESVDLSRIVLKIERHYNINIKFNDPFLGSKKISGKLKLREDKEDVLQVLASSSSTKLIKINEKNYVLVSR